MPKVNDFLNPTSMLTPGIAGGLTASISVPLAVNFGVSIKWVVLSVSFLVAVTIVMSIKEAMPVLQRTVYCVLNALIIFSTTLGVAVNMDAPPKPPAPPSASIQPDIEGRTAAIFSLLGIGAAEAANTSTGTTQPTSAKPNEPAKPAPSPADVERARKEKAYQEQQRLYQEQMQQHNKRWSW